MVVMLAVQRQCRRHRGGRKWERRRKRVTQKAKDERQHGTRDVGQKNESSQREKLTQRH